MDRRSFAKIMALFGLAPLWKGEKKVARIGDVFANWARGDKLNHPEIEQMRRTMNEIHAQSRQAGDILDNTGGLDPNVFSHKSGSFSILPHDSASMNAETDQTIPDETLTAIVFDTDAVLSADAARLSWESGIKRDVATGEFFLTGVPEDTIWLFSYLIHWDSTPTTSYVSVVEKDTATGWVSVLDDSTSVHRIQTGTFMMRARKASSSWQLKVWQSSGGTIDTLDALFQVARLR
jgi:hypothetical protein